MLALAVVTLAGCTMPGTQPTDEVVVTGNVAMFDSNSWKEVIADSCKSFNDGCNQCMKTENGDVACTKMYCETYEQPFCTDEEKVVVSSGKEYIGLTVEQAQKLADDNKTPFRVVVIDGEGQAVTMDYVIGRINASVSAGKVTAVDVEGSAQLDDGATSGSVDMVN